MAKTLQLLGENEAEETTMAKVFNYFLSISMLARKLASDLFKSPYQSKKDFHWDAR